MMEMHICTRNGDLLKAYALGDSDEVIVGRDDTCDVRIASKSISREHCAIEREGDELYIRDLGSSGGTLVDGEPLAQKTRVRDGMQVVIGPAILRFQEDDGV